MTLFKVVWAFDALAALIIFIFFFIGLMDGTVSARNAGLWVGIVAALTLILAGSVWFKRHGYPVPAYLLLGILALPAICFLGYMLIVICSGKSAWQ